MDRVDLELIESLSSKDANLKALVKRHKEFEAEIERMRNQKRRSLSDDKRLRELKKRKLQGRDQIEFILSNYRNGGVT